MSFGEGNEDDETKKRSTRRRSSSETSQPVFGFRGGSHQKKKDSDQTAHDLLLALQHSKTSSRSPTTAIHKIRSRWTCLFSRRWTDLRGGELKPQAEISESSRGEPLRDETEFASCWSGGEGVDRLLWLSARLAEGWWWENLMMTTIDRNARVASSPSVGSTCC